MATGSREELELELELKLDTLLLKIGGGGVDALGVAGFLWFVKGKPAHMSCSACPLMIANMNESLSRNRKFFKCWFFNKGFLSVLEYKLRVISDETPTHRLIV